MVIGTSLGAFITLNVQNKVKRIVINPTFDPYQDLQPLNASKEVYESYKGHSFYDEEIYKLTKYKFDNTFGMFGKKDPLFSYGHSFKSIFRDNQTFEIPNMEHQIKPNEIEKYLKPIVDYLMILNF